MDKDPVALTPFRVAVIVADSLAFTPAVETGKAAAVFPAGTVTDAGTVASVLSDFKATLSPLGPAGSLNATVPVEDPPPMTSEGLRVTESIFAGLSVSVAVREIAFNFAVMSADV